MIPNNDGEFRIDFTEYKEPSKTYKIDLEKGVIKGKCDGLESVKQAVYKVLNTERYDYLIYSWNYGVELKDLFGRPISLIYSELKRKIEESLLNDDRIKSVENFSYEKKKGTLSVEFTVVTTEGSFESEVKINV